VLPPAVVVQLQHGRPKGLLEQASLGNERPPEQLARPFEEGVAVEGVRLDEHVEPAAGSESVLGEPMRPRRDPPERAHDRVRQSFGNLRHLLRPPLAELHFSSSFFTRASSASFFCSSSALYSDSRASLSVTSISSAARAYCSASSCLPDAASNRARRLRDSRSSASPLTRSFNAPICFSLSSRRP